MYQCSEEQFLKNTAEHQMTVLREDGVDRHIRFRKPGTVCYGFDLITWPGHLCITGDCGTYVFARINDMFGFFRMDPQEHKEGLSINPGYWGEKLLAIGTNAGYREFDEEKFKERVKEHFDEWVEYRCLDTDAAGDLWERIEEEVLHHTDNEHEAYDAVYTFHHGDFSFIDFFDGGGTQRYTFHYIWCLYAIAWGIQQYDKEKSQ